MGIRLNSRLIPLAAGLALVVSLILVVPFHADDYGYLYLMQDPTQQAQSNPPNNSVFSWWAVGYSPSHMWWWAEDSIKGDVRTAIAAWAGVVPHFCTGYLSPKAGCWLTEVGSRDDADVIFVLDASMSSDKLADETPLLFISDSDRNASYLYQARVRINSNLNYSSGARATVVEHEIGHLFGLGERYLPGGSCGSDHSIMNAGITNYFGQVAAQSCNGDTGPTSLDQQRLNTFWFQGTLDNLSSNFTTDPNTAIFIWYDNAYSEFDDYITIQRNGDGSIVHYYYTQYIGMQESAMSRPLYIVFNRLEYSAPPGDYYLCGVPELNLTADFFNRFRCSPPIHLGP